jgi:hypothetical protein
MMDLIGIRKKDLIKAMAYIDSALSDEERTHFESYMQELPALKDFVLKQQRIKAAIHLMPKVKAPRSFVLKPDMVKQPKEKTAIFPVFRLASVIATVLLIVFIAGDLFLNREMSAPAPAYAPLASESAEDMKTEAESQDPMIVFWDAMPQGQSLGIGGSGGGASEMAVDAPKEAPAGLGESVESFIALEEPDSSQEETSRSENQESAEPVILGINLDEGGQILSEAPKNLERQVNEKTWPTIRWVQVSIGFLAIVMGMGALVLKKK